jgi:hypothetical protein
MINLKETLQEIYDLMIKNEITILNTDEENGIVLGQTKKKDFLIGVDAKISAVIKMYLTTQPATKESILGNRSGQFKYEDFQSLDNLLKSFNI